MGGVTLGPRQIGNFWIVDADGWIYWANGIRPNSTTSNILESVTLNSMLTDATGLEYYIHVDMEVCTQGELALCNRINIRTENRITNLTKL